MQAVVNYSLVKFMETAKLNVVKINNFWDIAREQILEAIQHKVLFKVCRVNVIRILE